MTQQLIGVDFSSAPSRRKPIVVALGQALSSALVHAPGHPPGAAGPLRLHSLQRFDSLPAFGQWLAQTPTWLGGFDLPFGLPRELVAQLAWPTDWAACMDHYCALDRGSIRDSFAAFCAARPVGGKFAHRACDGPAGSSPSMKWVNPPVAYMLHAGVPLLRAAGAWLPAHQPAPSESDAPVRVALEAYPGLLARALIGKRPYKSDTAAKQTADRLIARKDLIDALEQGRSPLGQRLKLSAAQRDALADDARGDALDAVLCLLQAGWAAQQPGYGLPSQLDPLEGWIVSA